MAASESSASVAESGEPGGPFSARPAAARAGRIAFWVLLLFGLILHVRQVARPIDATSYNSWRESDMGMIARNFWRGDLNIFYPQIDWRKDGPGYVECEFPLLPWLMAVAYRLGGYHEAAGRILSLGVSLASLLAFYRLARRALKPNPARLATLLFWLNPIMARFATNIQPDPGMVLGTILAALGLLRWRASGRMGDALAAGGAAALAILLKAPAASLGGLFAAVAVERLGWRAVRTPAVWAMAAAALLPPLAWYTHAYRFWIAYGNSMGLSNESHWIGKDILFAPRVFAHMIVGMLQIEVTYVYVGAGALLAALGLLRLTRTTAFLVYWLAGILMFYLLALHTTSNSWAIYYHALAIPPACLLMGLAVDAGTAPRCVPTAWLRPLRLSRAALVAATIMAFAYYSARTVDLWRPTRGEGPDLAPKYAAAKAFQPLVPPDALVVTLGDNHAWYAPGRPMAHDDSPLLFWMDRKGFALAVEEQSRAKLQELKARGAQFAVFREDFAVAPELARTFPVIATSGPWRLVRL